MIQDQLKGILTRFKGIQNADQYTTLKSSVAVELRLVTDRTGVVYEFVVKTSKTYNKEITSITFWPKYQSNPYKQVVEEVTWQFIPAPKPVVQPKATYMNVKIGNRTVSVSYTD